jgi:hypothetical protein
MIALILPVCFFVLGWPELMAVALQKCFCGVFLQSCREVLSALKPTREYLSM